MKKSWLALPYAFAIAILTFGLTVRAQAQTVTFLYQFSGTQGGATSMVQGLDGNLYGTSYAGDFGHGSVFRMTPNGDFTTIYSFCSQTGCPDGDFVIAGPVVGSDGNLYGVTGDGGNSSGSGTFYKMTPEGQITTLYSFCPSSGCGDGVGPNGVVLASDGNFYGTAEGGGKFDSGTIFSISPSGKFKLLHSFCAQSNCSDGASPIFPPIQGIDGNFYGTARTGGTNNGGVLYQLTAAGAYTVLYNFCNTSSGCTTGTNPNAIVQDAGGNFFGTTSSGGSTADGTVFELTSKNQYKVLHSFRGWDGEDPNRELTFASNGTLYGMTPDGGGPQEGNLFKVTPGGTFKSFFAFRCCSEGYDPFYGPLFQATNGNLYGTTLYGPSPCCYGTIFSVADGMGPLVETVPVAGTVGKQVIILGNGLKGSTSVKFNGKTASFHVVSDTEITTTVPAGATTGTVSVITPSGTLNSNPQFVVTK
jgi:uncharacterized repeat protein (TIGR03803 family)